MAAHAIAPGAHHLDEIIVLAETEAGAFESGPYIRQPLEQRGAVRNDQSDMAAQHLRMTGGQMELAAPDVHPHVVVGRHHVGIARQTETRAVIDLSRGLVGNIDVDVLEVDRIAEVFGRAIEGLVHPEFRTR